MLGQRHRRMVGLIESHAVGLHEESETVSTKELRKDYAAALRERLEEVGYSWHKQELRRATDAGVATFVVQVTATYGRLRTAVNLALHHDEFEGLLTPMLGSASELLPVFTTVRDLRDLTHAEWLDIRLEVNGPDEIEPVVDTIGRHAETTAPRYWDTIQTLGAVCAEPGLSIQRQPLALQLLGRDDELDALLTEWDNDPALAWLRPLAAPYRAGLPALTHLRPRVAAESADHVPFDRRRGR